MRQHGRTYTDRILKERSQRSLARDCPPHPKSQVYLAKGDYWTPQVMRCGRCGKDIGEEAIRDDA